MKRRILKNTTAIALIFFGLSSCSSYKHTYRISSIPDKNQKVGENYVFDVKPDLNKVVTATSTKHKNFKNAIDDAYYRAIVENNIHILVDPIYELKKGGRFLFFGGKHIVKVTGFAGYYVNPQIESDYVLNKQRKDLETLKITLELEQLKARSDFEKINIALKADSLREAHKVENFSKFAKNDVLNTVQKQTSIIDAREGKCCGNNSYGGGAEYGKLHLLTTTTSKPSLVGEYNKLICNDCTSMTNNSNKKRGIKLSNKK